MFLKRKYDFLSQIFSVFFGFREICLIMFFHSSSQPYGNVTQVEIIFNDRGSKVRQFPSSPLTATHSFRIRFQTKIRARILLTANITLNFVCGHQKRFIFSSQFFVTTVPPPPHTPTNWFGLVRLPFYRSLDSGACCVSLLFAWWRSFASLSSLRDSVLSRSKLHRTLMWPKITFTATWLTAVKLRCARMVSFVQIWKKNVVFFYIFFLLPLAPGHAECKRLIAPWFFSCHTLTLLRHDFLFPPSHFWSGFPSKPTGNFVFGCAVTLSLTTVYPYTSGQDDFDGKRASCLMNTHWSPRWSNRHHAVEENGESALWLPIASHSVPMGLH